MTKTYRIDETLYSLCEDVNAGFLQSGVYGADFGWYRINVDGSYTFLESYENSTRR